MKKRVINIGLIGAGMFGGDVHMRTYADLQRNGISPWLGRVGMDDFARPFADVEFELAGIATHTLESAERAQISYGELTGEAVPIFYGETPWVDLIKAIPDIDILAIATPDNLHFAPTIYAIEKGCHVIVEKPMVLDMVEADQIIALSKKIERLVGLDMHKLYDPDHLRIFNDLIMKMGTPLYGRAVLEEPLEVSAKTFKWAASSDPFTYVGPHWTNLFVHYLKVKPVSLFAVGQKGKLSSLGIDTFDAVQVEVIFNNGMHIHFQNNWITPDDFEGPVNQESEILGTEGKIESDSQYRGLQYWSTGKGTKTSNTHFTRDVLRPGGSKAYVGYGKDSLINCILAIIRMKFQGATLADIAGTYPDAKEARISVAILQAAAVVRNLNYKYLQKGWGTPVTAKFSENGIVILDPYDDNQKIYDQPI